MGLRPRVLLGGVLLFAACHDAVSGIGSQANGPSFSVVTDVTVTDLGTLAGGTFSQATDVNAAGQAAGYATTSGADFLSAHAVTWIPGEGIRDLGTLPGGNHSIALGVNNLGHVVGYSRTSTGIRPIHAFLWTPLSGMTDLGVVAGDESVALGINDAGQVSGWSTTASGEVHATVWNATGAISDLGTLGGDFSRLNFLNDFGQAAGGSRTAPNTFGPIQAFVWSSTAGLRPIGAINNGPTSEAIRINNLGQVVGLTSVDPASTYPVHAFLWTARDGMRDLGSLGGDYADALGINDLEQVVGLSTVTGQNFLDARPFLWTVEGGLVQLPAFGGEAGRAYDINDRGVAVGSARTAAAEDHAALWTITLTPPTPVEQVDNVAEELNNAVDVGALPAGPAQGLLAKLDAATRQVGRGNPSGAVNLLEAFIQQVEALVAGGALGQAVADSLIDAAMRAITELR